MRNEEFQMMYYKPFIKAWQMFKTDLVSVCESESWWDGVVERYAAVASEYQDTPAGIFVSALCCACVNELERLYRIQHGNIESVFEGGVK